MGKRKPKAAASGPFALVGFVETPGELTRVCEKLTEAGVGKIEAHTPFPVHGLEKALRLPASKVPWIALACGTFGGLLGFGLQWWVHAVAYPQNISGKPFFAYWAYVPITFELTVLFASFGCFFGMWGLNRLPEYYHPVHAHTQFARATDDLFFVAVEHPADVHRARALLDDLGVQGIEEVQP